jgi:tRNA pseudouridine55 synthase
MGKKTKFLHTHSGFILGNKRAGKTSFRALSPIKRAFPKHKVGHAGTLDEAASGLMLVAVGSATPLLGRLEVLDKRYQFELHFGHETSTGDEKGELSFISDSIPLHEHLETVIHRFVGRQEQIPPQYSALKIDGKRASDRIRAGESVELKSRSIEIFSLKILEQLSANCWKMEVHCSKGTYVRALGRDLGRALASAAHVEKIHRTAIGPYQLDDAAEMNEETNWSDHLLDIPKFFPHVEELVLNERLIYLVKNGVQLRRDQYQKIAKPGTEFFIRNKEGILVAMAEINHKDLLCPHNLIDRSPAKDTSKERND